MIGISLTNNDLRHLWSLINLQKAFFPFTENIELNKYITYLCFAVDILMSAIKGQGLSIKIT